MIPYTYDGLNRLADAQRGTLTGTFPDYTGVTSKNFAQDWALDQLGNWAGLAQDDDGNGTSDLEQERTHNASNEITGITTTTGTEWEEVQQDAAGNITWMPFPLSPQSSAEPVYDAWNRLVAMTDGELNIATYEYDGLGQRIVRVDVAADPDVTYHYYYNDQWQMLEERAGSSPNPAQQLVWHPYYIDALAVRWYDPDVDGANVAMHYYCQDGNFNVTALTDATGAVVERYAYSAYGEVTVLDPNFAEDADGISDIGNVHLYTGRERDEETGLQLNRNRYYAPHLGRWLTRDPIGYDGEDFNLYGYLLNSPLDIVDPSGERSVTPIIIDPPLPLPGKCHPEGRVRAYISKTPQTVTRLETKTANCNLTWFCPDGTTWPLIGGGTRTCQREVTYHFPAGTRYRLKCSGGVWRVIKSNEKPPLTHGPWKCGPCVPGTPWDPGLVA